MPVTRSAFAGLATVALATSCAPAGDISIRATVRAVEDGALGQAHAHLVARTPDRPEGEILLTVPVQPDGRVELRRTTGRSVWLRFTAVSRAHVDVPLVAAEHRDLTLDVRLGALSVAEHLRTVRVVGEPAEWFGRSGRAMHPQTDGTYVLDLQDAPARIEYQIAGAAAAARLVGEQRDSLVFDGGRGYRAVLRLDGRPLRLVFDPSRYPDRPRESSVVFGDSLTTSARFTKLLTEMEADRTLASQWRTAGGDGPSPELAGRLAAAVHQLRGEAELVIRDGLRLRLLNLILLGARSDSATAMQALTELPAASPVWTYQPFLVNAPFRINDLVMSALVQAGVPRDTAVLANHPLYLRYVEAMSADHPDAFVRMGVLYGALRAAHAAKLPVRIGDYYRRLISAFPTSFLAPIAKARFSPERNIVQGQPVPPFAFHTMDDPGEQVSDSSLLGKVYLLDFWATWCGPCIAQFPSLHELHERYGARGFEIVSVSMDDKPELVTAFRGQRWAMPWTNVFLGPAFDTPEAQRFDLSYLPRPILVGADGRVHAFDVGAEGTRLRQALAELFPDRR